MRRNWREGIGLRRKRSTGGSQKGRRSLRRRSRRFGGSTRRGVVEEEREKSRARARIFLTGAHADALDGLEEFAFGLNAGSDDDFSLLKLMDRRRTDIAHAGGDSASEVLRTVIDGGWTEKDLLQRAGDA